MSKVEGKKLGDILNLKRGYDLPSYEREDGLYPIFSSSGISGYHSQYKADGEGVVIGRYGTLGEPYYVNGKYWPHNTSLYVTDFKGNSPKYVYYLLKCLGDIKTSDKSTVPGVNRNELHEMSVPFVKVRDQQDKIAAVLSALDAKIELNNRINAELESLAKTIYDYWFVQFDFPNSDGKPYKSSGGEMVYVEEGSDRAIPAGWEIGTLYDLANIAGGSTPSTANPLNFCKNGTAWITPKDLSLNMGNKFISKGELDVTEAGMKDASLKIFPKDTILLSSRAPIGYMAISRNDVTTNQGFKSFIPNKGFSTPFVYYAIKNSMQSIVQHASG
ncbi:MAG: restriction endonuclease subunit S [Pseudanabaena sp.]|jgi:type I restriction enzyme S subunit|nr:restriction endonuclease subunit S [Pseudanabaena sp. M53BS1SP1A06MG]MCA6583636.1 restriction endonuclease subunit S [Pseudanabaena sp. M34BS1SP1A06MG]MCA6591775.1 restriction endonuclease subunit S [Pseudanabaena sp. M38BS1SP1A06MG]MCA6600310.1 restriction endonuclease subunit S [Pseudanabaena sp. M57BS1SP1A06MG]